MKYPAFRVITVCTLAVAAGVSVPAQQPPAPVYLTTVAERHALERAIAERTGFVPGEVIVKFRPGTTAVGQMRAMDALRSRPLPDRLQWIGERTARLRVNDGMAGDVMAANLSRQPEVEYAHPNWLLTTQQAPNDPTYVSRQWNMSTIDMPGAWAINPGASGIVIAVIDTGVTTVNATYTFPTWNGSAIVGSAMPFAMSPDLDPARLVTGRDFVFWTGPVLDSNGHGTHVSATAAQSTNNNFGAAGVAYNARVMPLKACYSFWDLQILMSAAGEPGYGPPVDGVCPTSAVVAAVRYAADNGAHVINLSLGNPGASQAMLDALSYAVGKGVFVAIAAGNDFQEGNPVTYPAAYAQQLPGVMAVAAVGPSLARAPYSTTGSFVEIAAPGGNLAESGDAGLIWQWGINFSDYNPAIVIFPRFDRYGERGLQGTSMAAPHVAGVAALLMSQGIKSPAAIEAILARTARDRGAPGRDDEFGAGLIQPRAALRGFGVVR